MKFNFTYFLLATMLFFTEAYIATYVHDDFVRPFLGDLLVVILLYCAVKAVVDWPVQKAVLLVLLIAYGIELSQYFHLSQLLGLENSKVAAWLIGSYFSFIDLLMYTAGALLIIITEKALLKYKTHGTAVK